MARYACAAPPVIPPSSPAVPREIPCASAKRSTSELVKRRMPPVVLLSIQACSPRSG